MDEQYMEKRIKALLNGILDGLFREGVPTDVIARGMLVGITRAVETMEAETVQGEDAQLRNEMVAMMRGAIGVFRQTTGNDDTDS